MYLVLFLFLHKKHNRYDSRGPQLALYLPGPFHQGGSNDLIAFETDGERLDPSPMFRFLDQALWRTKSA